MRAWDIIHTKSYDQSRLESLRELFPDNDNLYIQERKFSKLHEAVLGIGHLDLEQALISNGGDIDMLDSNGSSPLMWAIRRRDAIAVELLLNAGADPNARIKRGTTALHFAAWSGDLISIKILLQYGAMATHTDSSLRNALHFAAQFSRGSEICRTLLAAGIDIEAQDIWGTTALGFCASENKVSEITLLLDLGAQINAADAEGDTPLLEAVRFSQNDSLSLLLKRGADYTLSNVYGNSILHKAAQYGDLQTLNIIFNANLEAIDPYARNVKGKIAFELAQERSSKPGGFIDLLLTLIFEIRNRNDYLAGCQRPNGEASVSGRVLGEINEDESSSHGSDGEEFFDAQEQ